LKATILKAIAAATPSAARTLLTFLFLVVGNNSRNPFDPKHHLVRFFEI
jgi:hypothetical protein